MYLAQGTSCEATSASRPTVRTASYLMQGKPTSDTLSKHGTRQSGMAPKDLRVLPTTCVACTRVSICFAMGRRRLLTCQDRHWMGRSIDPEREKLASAQ